MAASPRRLSAVHLPGVTTDGPLPSGLAPTWAKHARKAINRMRNAKTMAEMQPFLADAEKLLDAKMAQVATVAGRPCGPIEANGLMIAAQETAFAMWFFAKAGETGDAKTAMIAAKLGDSARVNDNAAYEMAVRIARQAPRQEADPLAAYLSPAPAPPESGDLDELDPPESE